MDIPQLCNLVGQAFLLVLGAALSVLVITWRLWLTTRYLKEALARELRSSFAKQKSLVISNSTRSSNITRSLLEIFLREPVPNLRDLVERTEREFQLRASAQPSEESTDTIEMRTSDFIQR